MFPDNPTGIPVQRGCSFDKYCNVVKGDCQKCHEDKCNSSGRISIAIETLIIFVLGLFLLKM